MQTADKNLIIIGFMGSGKSTLGRTLAKRLKRPFIDTDKEIEKIYNLPVSEIFRRFGEIRFRSEEHILTKKLAVEKGLVISTGGGLVSNRENLRLLKENGVIIRVKADAKVLHERLMRRKGERPLVKKDLTLKELKKYIEEREEAYSEADIVINTGNLGREAVVDEVLALLKPYLIDE